MEGHKFQSVAVEGDYTLPVILVPAGLVVKLVFLPTAERDDAFPLPYPHTQPHSRQYYFFFGQKILFYSALTEEVSYALESVLPGDKVT